MKAQDRKITSKAAQLQRGLLMMERDQEKALRQACLVLAMLTDTSAKIRTEAKETVRAWHREGEPPAWLLKTAKL